MVDMWTRTPLPQEFPSMPAPGDGIARLLDRLKGISREVSEATSNLLSQAGVRARPGMLSSLDFDGDGGHTNLGTKGWMLGSSDGGDSFFILNGHLIIEELEAQDLVIGGLIDDLAAQDIVILGQQDALAEVVANQLGFDGDTAIVNGVGIPQDTYAAVCSVTLDAPAWATRASVTANGVVTATATGGAALIQGRVVIGADASPNFEQLTQTAGNDMSVTPIHWATFDPGATIVVTLEARRTLGSSSAGLARLVASATFAR